MGASAFLEELRQATRAAHTALDARAGMDGHVTRERYVAFLRGSLAAVERVEPVVARFARGGRELDTKSRVECLRADLRALGAVPSSSSHQRAPLRELASEAGAVGATYVVEGSTLGGVVMARSIEAALGLDRRAQSYLRYGGERPGEAWRHCVEQLTTWGNRASDEQRRLACVAAQAVFGVYEFELAQAGALND